MAPSVHVLALAKFCKGFNQAIKKEDSLMAAATAATEMLIALHKSDATLYNAVIKHLFTTGSTTELQTIYKALPALPEPQSLLFYAEEGVRSNIDEVFFALALQNPYARDYFDQNMYNRLVMKVIAKQAAIDQVIGLEQRVNGPLLAIIKDYMAERMAAGRPVNQDVAAFFEKHSGLLA